jgi:hypothetical protein
MATEEAQHDVSLDSITTSNVDAEHNDVTSPVESSPTKTANTNEASATDEASAEPGTSDVAEEPKSPSSMIKSPSPSKPKASVTTEAKKVVKTVTGSVKGAPASAVKKVSY